MHVISHRCSGQLERSGDLGWSPLFEVGLGLECVVSWRDMCRASSLKIILFTLMLVAEVRGVTGPCVPNHPAGQLGLICPAEVGGPGDKVEVSKASHGLGLGLGQHLYPDMLSSKAGHRPALMLGG